MTVFADSSALVKLYADEADAELVRAHLGFVVSALARVEVPAALWRKHRIGELAVEDAALLAAEFAADWHDPDGPFLAVSASGHVLSEAAELVARYGLRAYDGVQLACGAAARAADADIETFLSFDADLCAAAVREGFQLLS